MSSHIFYDIKEGVDKITIKLKENETEKKLKLDIYVPLNLCACMYEHFITRVFSIIMEYTQLIDFETKSLKSDEAKKLNLHGNCIVIEGKKVVTEPYQLKKEIPRLLKEKGLL